MLINACDFVLLRSDQGALQQQSRLQQQVSDRLQQLKQQLQQTSAAGGSNCEGADGQEWQQQIAQAERVLDELLKEVQNLHRVYQQVRRPCVHLGRHSCCGSCWPTMAYIGLHTDYSNISGMQLPAIVMTPLLLPTVYLDVQELSVWADVAAAPDHTSPVGGLHAADNTLQAADSVGQAAQRIVVAYQGLTAALDGFGGVMKQHQALQVSN